jgi:holin-like protein
MLLFFVPAMLVVTEYPDLIRHQGLRILAVIVASTACVMAVTALAVDRVYRLELWLASRKSTARARRAVRGGVNMLSNEVIGLLSLPPPWPATGSTSACTAATRMCC